MIVKKIPPGGSVIDGWQYWEQEGVLTRANGFHVQILESDWLGQPRPLPKDYVWKDLKPVYNEPPDFWRM